MKKGLCNYIRFSAIMLSISLSLAGIVFENYNVVLWGIMILYLQNILYCLEDLKGRMYLLMFYITIFVFLLSRPVISMFQKTRWWEQETEAGVQFALLSISIALICLQLGGWCIENRLRKINRKKNPTNKEYKKRFKSNLQIISGTIFYCSMFFYMLLELEKVAYMQGKAYTEYYVSFQSQAPGIVYILSTFMIYSLCIFLATLPSKRAVIIPLGLYWLSAVPSLIIGMRNPIMLHSIFIFLYFYMRDAIGGDEKWIGKLERTAIIIAVPFVLVFMAAYTYIRGGESASGLGIMKLFVGFFYGQGVSFDVLAIGYRCIPFLPSRAFRNYTFGGIIDYLIHGSFAQRFFGAEALENGNGLKNALISNNFAHNMSYVAKGDKYLKGEGWGSSFLLETYTDYGYVGVAVFSILLGALLVYGAHLWKKNGFLLMIMLLILTKIFFAPRSGATEALEFLVTAQFWCCVLVCYLGAGLCCKRYEARKLVQEE